MPSPRRTKALLVALMSVLGLTLFLTYYTSSSQSPYMRTLRSVTSPGGRLSSSSEPVVPALPAASYCPYSKKAKALLLDKYSIVPAPYVVELDLRDNGAQLQAELEVVTGRGTVPNVLVNGKSIGGGDDVEQLDTDGTLKGTLLRLGGERITQVSLQSQAQ